MELLRLSARRLVNIAIIIFALTLLSACGGSESGNGTSTPGSPLEITVNTGDGSLSLGWKSPASNGGSAILGYLVETSPAIPAANITIIGTTALVRNLTNGTNYQISIRASNSNGTGPASTAVFAQPKETVAADYTPINIQGDNSPSGVYDPSILHASDGVLWLSYSSVNFYNNTNSQLVQDVETRIARSDDGGITFTYVATLASPDVATVTDTDPALSACGLSSCTGRWVYETSWLIEDAGDPDPNRRFKLFAHKYFLYPPNTAIRTFYHLGSIVMWTASAPDATWSTETSLLGWNLTPPELSSNHVVNSLDPSLGNCLLVTEGAATVSNSQIVLAFACPYLDSNAGNEVTQKIILLRSTDHLSTLQYVSTLLSPTDAAQFGAHHFSAPALITTQDNAPILLATPVINDRYAGSRVFPFADDGSNGLFRSNGLAESILLSPVMGFVGGASTYTGALGQLGILQSDATVGAALVDTQFSIVATHALPR